MSWCLPAWHDGLLAVRPLSKQHGPLSVTGCEVVKNPPSETGISVQNVVPCDPEVMRSATEEILRNLSILAQDEPLPFQTYALARAIASEAGAQAVPEEQVAIGEASLNRVKSIGGTLETNLLRDGKYFGRQRGSNPAVSTSQDPTIENIIAARLVLSGATDNFAKGATNWFSPRYVASPTTLLDSWTGHTSGTPQMAWIGHLPNVDVKRFLFLRYAPGAYRSGTGRSTWQKQYDAARAILTGAAPTMRAAPTRTCPEATRRLAALAGVGVIATAAVGIAAVNIYRRSRA